MKRILMALALGLAATLPLGIASAAVEPGQPAPSFKATDLDGHAVSLDQYRGKVVVLEWNNPGCPFVQKHYNSGNMQHLQGEFTQRGVVWLTVNSTNPGNADYRSPDLQKAWNTEKKLASTDYLRDADGTLGRLYGAKTTPHMFVIDTHGMIAYAGGIDDRRTTEVADVNGARNYVAEALDAVLAGRAVQLASATPYGCSVKY
jgi:peroxiredoxin